MGRKVTENQVSSVFVANQKTFRRAKENFPSPGRRFSFARREPFFRPKENQKNARAMHQIGVCRHETILSISYRQRRLAPVAANFLSPHNRLVCV